ncbi:MAG: toprim domain-containing protein [archaeon]
MKFNPVLKQQVAKFTNYIIIVEGNKDALIMKELGFERVYTIHKTGVSIKERIEQISSTVDKKDRVCILTDLDKKGKKLYMLVKELLQEEGVKLDSTLRSLLIKAQITHIEDIKKFMKQVERI